MSLQQALPDGLAATGDAIVALVRHHRAELVVIDGFRGLRGAAEDPQAARRFLYTLGATLGTLGVTTIVTSVNAPGDSASFPETTTADLIVQLHYGLQGVRQMRGLEVIKQRGKSPLAGLHAFGVDASGVRVFPQLEERIARELHSADLVAQGAVTATTTPTFDITDVAEQRVGFGQAAFDATLSGGVLQGTTTLVTGGAGTGKTLLGVQFALAGAQNEEATVFVSFRESPRDLVQLTAPFTFGVNWAQALASADHLTFLHFSSIKLDPDMLADHVLAVLERTHAQRLVIDSIDEWSAAINAGASPQRQRPYWTALHAALRQRQVTSLWLQRTTPGTNPQSETKSAQLADLAENVLHYQQATPDGQGLYALSVIKQRATRLPMGTQAFRITEPVGMVLLDPMIAVAQDSGRGSHHRHDERADA